MPEGYITLEQVLAILDKESYLLSIIILTLPLLVPVSIPGIGTAFGSVIILIVLGIIRDRPLWLPKSLKEKTLCSERLKTSLHKGIRWLHVIDKVSKPRFLWLSQHRNVRYLNSIMIILSAILLLAPFPFIPFSNTLPALAILFLAIGMLQRDGGCIAIGYVSNVITIVYFMGLITLGTNVLHIGIDKTMQIF